MSSSLVLTGKMYRRIAASGEASSQAAQRCSQEIQRWFALKLKCARLK